MMEMLKSFKKLIADAVPQPPRSSKTKVKENIENINPKNEQETPEEVRVDSEDDTKNEKPKPKSKKNFFSKKNSGAKENSKGAVVINTQATGNVMTFVNANNLQFGNTYNLGVSSKQETSETYEPTEHIEKCNLVQLLMEAQIQPEHEFRDYVSKNLGKNWQNFFRKLGFSKGAIETMEIDTKSYGVSEARYRLLLRWIEDSEENTLGRLATLLWEEGERQVVRELALMYNKGQ